MMVQDVVSPTLESPGLIQAEQGVIPAAPVVSQSRSARTHARMHAGERGARRLLTSSSLQQLSGVIRPRWRRLHHHRAHPAPVSSRQELACTGDDGEVACCDPHPPTPPSIGPNIGLLIHGRVWGCARQCVYLGENGKARQRHDGS